MHQVVSIVTLLILVLTCFINHQLIDASGILEYLIINQPLLLNDPLVILYFLLLPLHDVLKILFLGRKTRGLVRYNILPADDVAQVVKALFAGRALGVRGGWPRIN